MKLKDMIKLVYPPVWLIALLVPVCAAALVYTFVCGYEEHPVAYLTYILSFYTLTCIVIRCTKIIPKHYRTAKNAVYSNPVGNRFMTDMKFRTHVTLYGSLGVNFLYAAVNIASGIINHTAWFHVLAFYYIILAVMRFLLLRFVNGTGIGNNRLKELCCSRVCGYIMLAINLFLSGAVLMILYQDKGYEYHGVIIYVVALYTFWLTAVAIKNLIKYKKLGSPVMSMSKIISMAAALVSMLSLETAMLSEFGGEMSHDDKWLMIALTGAGVSIIIVAMSVYSIVKNSREIRQIAEKMDTAG
ncbi:MAG: hypothetical protein IKK53_06150 [Ruminiclostridium sp.]|nr:hypothetical protein [Ruminiclostridium sp.]